MVKQKPKVILSFAGLLVLTLTSFNINYAFAVDANTNFEVNVIESLSVSVTTPTVWASGDMDEFLRNPVSVSVTTNSTGGFIATMSSKTTSTALTNTSNSNYTLPTLASNSTRGSFPANRWGYSLNDTVAGSSTSTYSAMVPSNATPITLIQSSGNSGNKDFYFGAKGNASLPSGTYTGIVVINVVSGATGTNNPVTPTNPATPNPSNDVAVYHSSPTGGSTSGTTTYTQRSSSSGNTTTTTDVTAGNNWNLYQDPQGVISNTSSKISTNSALATGLALTATVAATSGMFLVIAARREGEDDEEPPEL